MTASTLWLSCRFLAVASCVSILHFTVVTSIYQIQSLSIWVARVGCAHLTLPEASWGGPGVSAAAGRPCKSPVNQCFLCAILGGAVLKRTFPHLPCGFPSVTRTGF